MLHGIAAALPVFREQGRGHFVTTVSTAGLTITPTMAVYAATKNAVRTLLETLRAESTDGVLRSTVISPGYIRTGLASSISDPDVQERVPISMDALGIPPEAVARTIAFTIELTSLNPLCSCGSRLGCQLVQNLMSLVRRMWRALLRDLDLYALVLAGLVFTILGTFGIADVKTLSSVTLALLSWLAFSQVRQRRLTGDASPGPESAFHEDFPVDLGRRRTDVRTEYLFIGVSGYRTVGAGLRDFKAMLDRGVKLRFIFLDPANESAVRLAASTVSYTQEPDRLRQRIQGSIHDLQNLQSLGNLEIRVLPFVPNFGANVFDMNTSQGAAYIQHFEFRATGESGPIFCVAARNGHWFDRYRSEVERLWAAGTPI